MQARQTYEPDQEVRGLVNTQPWAQQNINRSQTVYQIYQKIRNIEYQKEKKPKIILATDAQEQQQQQLELYACILKNEL